jgi:hypothetical protein
LNDKVIRVEKAENVNKVFYKEKLIGVYIDGDTNSVADVIDLALDECLERKATQLEKQLPPLLQKLMEECYRLGYNRKPANQSGIFNDILNVFF